MYLYNIYTLSLHVIISLMAISTLGCIFFFSPEICPKFCIFISLDLISYNFIQHDFRSFSDKKGLLLGGPKPFSGGGGGNTGAGGGGLWPLQYIC